MRDMRGNWYKYGDIPVMVTYHPAYLLRNPDEKRKVWYDMKKVKQGLIGHEKA
jgi:DNA polymerase